MSNYVTQKEFKDLTSINTSDFALKTNVAEIKNKVDSIDVDKINSIDELQGKNYVKDCYLCLNQEYEYFGIEKTNLRKLLFRKSAGISNEQLEPPEDKKCFKMLLLNF